MQWDSFLGSIIDLSVKMRNGLHHLNNCMYISRNVMFQIIYVGKSVLKFCENLSSLLVVSHMKGRTLKSTCRFVIP